MTDRTGEVLPVDNLDFLHRVKGLQQVFIRIPQSLKDDGCGKLSSSVDPDVENILRVKLEV